jgi:hypothetical protein
MLPALHLGDVDGLFFDRRDAHKHEATEPNANAASDRSLSSFFPEKSRNIELYKTDCYLEAPGLASEKDMKLGFVIRADDNLTFRQTYKTRESFGDLIASGSLDEKENVVLARVLSNMLTLIGNRLRAGEGDDLAIDPKRVSVTCTNWGKCDDVRKVIIRSAMNRGIYFIGSDLHVPDHQSDKLVNSQHMCFRAYVSRSDLYAHYMYGMR